VFTFQNLEKVRTLEAPTSQIFWARSFFWRAPAQELRISLHTQMSRSIQDTLLEV
jgi:hypothetical protein